jgi:hypothetical protein
MLTYGGMQKEIEKVKDRLKIGEEECGKVQKESSMCRTHR